MDYLLVLAFLSITFAQTIAELNGVACSCPWSAEQFNQLQQEVQSLREDVNNLQADLSSNEPEEVQETNEIQPSTVGLVFRLDGEQVADPRPPEDKIEGFVYAKCKPMPNSALSEELFQPITGEINMKQNASGGPLYIDMFMYGFRSPLGSLHGFHVHTYGDLSDGCQSTGGHYNPFNKNHGGPKAEERHVGDLGNVEPNAAGVVNTKIEDDLASLVGEHSIIGRAFVIHAGEDDLGLGGFPDSLTTGHAGARLACCVIGIAEQ
ncbi:Superoxide dismutase [Cu-Zn] [Holothuria leucospilota]|uniref:Superoxide dismutase [Cu-Zn] n=1 Tax=Holothuria leucospilota TaxID=206669 RepID=A0A9Q1HJJ3_HOLLE|nr:Superoxide dismutase [Cu-Zn] [Holothuria leucospilota]